MLDIYPVLSSYTTAAETRADKDVVNWERSPVAQPWMDTTEEDTRQVDSVGFCEAFGKHVYTTVYTYSCMNILHHTPYMYMLRMRYCIYTYTYILLYTTHTNTRLYTMYYSIYNIRYNMFLQSVLLLECGSGSKLILPLLLYRPMSSWKRCVMFTRIYLYTAF